jgi:cephalosporin hydroxylase
MNFIEEFNRRNDATIKKMSLDKPLHEATQKWFEHASRYEYSYHFTWMGRPIIQFPPDVMALQEILWEVKPDLVIETGIAHGGSLVFYASILELIGKGDVLGIDIEVRKHNRRAIETHPMFKRISMIEGSSVAEEIMSNVRELAKDKDPILIILDSNHTHEHVLKELEFYSTLVTAGSYLVVMDTIIEDMPSDFFPDRPWGKGNNPKTAVWQFLKKNNRFVINKDIETKLLISVAPDGYLKCIKA